MDNGKYYLVYLLFRRYIIIICCWGAMKANELCLLYNVYRCISDLQLYNCLIFWLSYKCLMVLQISRASILNRISQYLVDQAI